MADSHFDILIIGAGVSGIGIACHLRRDCPDKRFVILERRADIGGTWDLFRYPGIRSDSDMLTFGYNFRPWMQTRLLADGPSIKQYLDDTAQAYDIYQHIRLNISADHADWSSSDKCWRLTIRNEQTRERAILTCNFLVCSTGYYRYDAGYRPDFPGEERFKGPIIHPQQWPENLDYSGKRVVVIGSGATAVTLIPAMAADTASITLLQRSPSYVLPIPGKDKLAEQLYRVLPEKRAYALLRQRNIALQRWLYNASRRWPGTVRKILHRIARSLLARNFDMRHFEPHYNPWDERLCISPDGDLFRVLRQGKAEIVTDQIDSFTENGIRLASGFELEADMIISATGLQVRLHGGMNLTVDGEPVDFTRRMMYKAVMLEGVPNLITVFGYVNVSWTLKVDLIGTYLCRLINHMEAHGHQTAIPVDQAGCRRGGSMIDALRSGYACRAAPHLPRQGSRAPWRVTHDYHSDKPMLCKAPINDSILQFDMAVGTDSAVAEV